MKVRMIFGTKVGTKTFHAHSILRVPEEISEEEAKALITLGRAEPHFTPGEIRHQDPMPTHQDPKPEVKKGK